MTGKNMNLTMQPVQTGNPADYRQEWGRTPDVQRVFGIKRGSLYNLFKDGKVYGKERRIRGKFKGIRLWDMDSIRRYIESECDSLEGVDRDEKAPPVNQTGPRLTSSANITLLQE